MSTIFILKMCFTKNFAVTSFIALSGIGTTLFITAKQNNIFTSEQLKKYGNFAFDKQMFKKC